jgi:hypothetical protein
MNTSGKLKELEDQLKSYENKLSNYERDYKKSFTEDHVNEKYQKYLEDTILWVRGKIDSLFGVRTGFLQHQLVHSITSSAPSRMIGYPPGYEGGVGAVSNEPDDDVLELDKEDYEPEEDTEDTPPSGSEGLPFGG